MVAKDFQGNVIRVVPLSPLLNGFFLIITCQGNEHIKSMFTGGTYRELLGGLEICRVQKTNQLFFHVFSYVHVGMLPPPQDATVTTELNLRFPLAHAVFGPRPILFGNGNPLKVLDLYSGAQNVWIIYLHER